MKILFLCFIFFSSLCAVDGQPFKSNPSYIEYVETKDIIRDTSKLESIYRKYYVKYIEYIAPNKKPILIVAQDKVSDEQLLKAYNILSFYLTPYGKYDKNEIANNIANNHAVLVMPNGADREGHVPEEALEGQPLYQMEVPTAGSTWYLENDYEHRDASYEEILHMVHDYGVGIQSNSGASPVLQKKIFEATMNALPKDKKEWSKKGLWGLGDKEVKNWLLELAQEGSLEQEYLASVVDSYYGLWISFEEEGGMWGLYSSKTREDIKVNDPLGYEVVSSFLSPYLTYMARINPSFEGTFKMYYDKQESYTNKSKYLINVKLIGKNNSNLIGNNENNILIGNEGNNIIDGKNGKDVVQFSSVSINYKISIKKDKITVIDKANIKHIDTLLNIEVLRFKDKDILVKNLSAS